MQNGLLKLIRFATFGLAVLAASGCATKQLWERGSVSAFNEPAPEPRLRLYQVPPRQDVLVVYEEFSERKAKVRTRAYFLKESTPLIEHGRRPHFVDAASARKLEPLSAERVDNKRIRPTQPGLCAMVITNDRNFTLWLDGQSVSDHELPVYDDGSGRVKQVLLTPVTVVADLTIVGGCLFLLAWSSGSLYWLGN